MKGIVYAFCTTAGRSQTTREIKETETFFTITGKVLVMTLFIESTVYVEL